MGNYPPSSQPAKNEKQEEPQEIKKVIQGKAVRQKKPLGRRFREAIFGGEDATSVFEYIVQDVMVPAAKDMLSDAVSQAVERMLFGEVRSRRRGVDRGNSTQIAYNKISTSLRRDDPRPDPRDPRAPRLSSQARETHDFDEILLETKGEADDVLEQMYELLSRFNQVTVADLLQMLGEDVNYMDRRWGWTSLAGSEAVRVKGGYLLSLPRTTSLK